MKPNKILISPKADEDIYDIKKYSLEFFGAPRTKLYLTKIRSCLKTILKNPNIGTSSNNFLTGLRFYKVGSHLIFYKKKNNKIIVIRILHKSMNHKNHL